MLLQFGTDEPASFPTADLPGSVDVVWLAATQQVLSTQTVEVCQGERMPAQGPAEAQWALAVPAGDAERLGLTAGSTVDW